MINFIKPVLIWSINFAILALVFAIKFFFSNKWGKNE